MSFKLVKKVTIVCPSCETSIKFNIHPGNDEIREVYNAADTLDCPKCKSSLSYSAREMVQAVHGYNSAVTKLVDAQKKTESELD